MNSELLRIIESGESESVEFKGPQASVEVVAREVCAMLNQRGGVILWGITDDRRIVGIRDAEEQAQKLNAHIARHLRPRPLLSILVDNSQKKSVIVIDIPQSVDKPYSINREIWIRLATRILRASADVSTELVERAVATHGRWEREAIPGFGIEDCDRDEIANCRLDMSGSGRFGTALPETDEQLLEALSLVRFNQPTNACLVLFAKNASKWAPQLGVRITSYGSHAKESIAFDTALHSPAVDTVRRVIAIIQQQTGVSSGFNETSLQRQDRPAYAQFALREGLVNAVVHRDYAALGEVRVEIYPDHLLIHNPGRLPEGMTASDLRRDHVSKPINPDIAKTFLLRGYMEQLGAGTQKLIGACRAIGARSPVWGANKGTVTLQIFRAPVAAVLSSRQSNFVHNMISGKHFSLADYARSAKVSERQARRDLADLIISGVAIRQGKGRATTYLLRPQSEDVDVDAENERLIRKIWQTAPTSNQDAEKSVDAMVRWFFERFEDPANGVPHDSGEGGYQYVAGGPYNAEDELRQVFDDGSAKMDRLITSAARRIESDGWEWVKKGEY